MSYLQNEAGNLNQWEPDIRKRLARRWRRLKIGPWLRRERALRARTVYDPITGIPKSISEHKEAVFVRGRIQTVKPKITPKIDSGVIVETWKRPGPVQLKQWEALPAIVSAGMRIFGGKKGPSRSAKASAAISGAEARVSQIQTLGNLITRLERFIQTGCPGRSVVFRTCWVEACMLGKKLGWPGIGIASYKGKPFPGCQPYDVEFDSAMISLTNFFREKLPELKAQLEDEKRRVTAPSTYESYVEPRYEPYTTPYLPIPTQPSIITLPAAPTFYEEPVPVKAGIDPQFLVWGGLGLLALIMIQK